MKWLSDSKALIMLLYNFGMFYINRPDYQHALFGVYQKFGWSLYNDAIWLASNFDFEMPDQSFMHVGEIAVSSGYAFEEHKVVTEDGYILTAFRIPGKLMES